MPSTEAPIVVHPSPQRRRQAPKGRQVAPEARALVARLLGDAPRGPELLIEHLHRLQDAVAAAPAEDWDAARMAAVAHVTPRHLARLFREHTSLSARGWLEQVRATLAAQALRQGRGEREAVALAGFSSPRQMRQALARQRA